jgi:putative salt-induced outer membrane protein YdiY
MTRYALVWIVLWATCCFSPALADEIVLASGDVLTGTVTREGDGFVLQHPELGTLRIDGDKVRSCTLGASTSAATPAARAESRRVVTRAPVCAPPATVPKAKETGCKRPWDLSFTLGLSDENGNTDEFAYNVDVEGEYRWSLNRVHARFRSSYEENSRVQTEGEYYGLVEYSRRVSARGRVWGRWQFDRDDFADLLYRSGLFAGYGYDLVKTERTSFSAGAGVGYVVEERESFPRLETLAFAGLLDFRHEFRHGDTFRANYWIIPYVEETERSPMRLELRYAHPLRDHFDVTASFILDYVPDPPEPGIEPYDTKLLLGLRWKP